ncbi:lycopene cyclase domain protein [Kribbella flavida DSM 17836]|uniref:Lycopene cyclase domain protein n=1 Tax=Kribbella flavida (strain DSM 17836 / JCM 10339 / NBRC 14399) TaxID=479435 RepID=D2PPZ0_KRIFD|nr:lycopene cyclase domain-containing protein [Kribbella flavida]ADB32914.1 lycopene cyclase domain protein [Kribbella flavida DSM 17836]
MDRWHYLLVMAACVAITLPLELLGARVYRRPRRWLLALLPVVTIFLVWDAIAIAGGVWGYNPQYLTGWSLPFRIPVEEFVFFVVVPTCGLLTYETVGLMLERIGRYRRTRREQVRP